jgi:thiol:disulfide interchange protein DsbD
MCGFSPMTAADASRWPAPQQRRRRITPFPSGHFVECLKGFLLALLCVAASGLAQGPPKVVDAHLVLASDGVHPGMAQKAAIVASVAAGYHINAHKPSFDYLIPTEAKFKSNPAVDVVKVQYPGGKAQKLSFSDDPLSVYQGKFLIGLVLKIPASVAPGTYTLSGKLAYQACNDRACLAPASVPLAVTLNVVPGSVPLKPENMAIFQQLHAARLD